MSKPVSVLSAKKIGVILVNLGTPDKADYWSVRRYLSEFLSDKRVIELPFIFWQPLLQGIILTIRPHKVAKSYQRVWNKAENKSPLAVITQGQAEKIKARFSDQSVHVEWAMRYGKPSIQKAIDALSQKGCDHLLVVPLYPQYSATTTAAVNDKVFQILMAQRRQPALRTLFSYADDPAYINALKEQVEAHCASLSTKPERILISFHGLPQRYVNAGDPYAQECEKTAHALRQALGKTAEEMPMVFQSRFGPDRWLEPNIADVIKGYKEQNIQNIAVIAPGFLADCLETLEEINHEYRALFLSEGGKEFSYFPCLNDEEITINFLENLIQKELQGWI